MRVLISAYACEPDRGSEPEVGLQTVLSAAAEHDVWAVTRTNNLPKLDRHLLGHPLAKHIHLIGHDVGGLPARLKKRGGLATLHWYYDAWQRRLADLAIRLDKEIGFDLVHHVTFASYWTRVGVTAVNKPLVWGPVGGGAKPPLSLIPSMGIKGGLADIARVSARPAAAIAFGAQRTAREARVVLTQNTETAGAIRANRVAVVLPNALVAGRSIDIRNTRRVRKSNVLFAGRLIALKGVPLVIKALTRVSRPEVTFDIYGEGPERGRLEKLVRRFHLTDRVTFHGQVGRSRLLTEIAEAGALVHPALHDEAPFVIGEALSQGTPVICLDRGGPPILADYWPGTPSHVIELNNRATVEFDIASAIDELVGLASEPRPPIISFEEEILNAYERASDSGL